MPVCAKILAQRSPSNGTSATKFAQQVQKHQFWGVFSAMGELFRAHAHAKPSRAKDFAHRTKRRSDFETDNTSATEKHAKNTHFSPAKAMTVSTDPPQRPAKATPVSDNHAARSYKPTPQQTRMQFDWVKFQRSLKTAQFQRCYFKIRKGRGGIACEIECGLRNVGSDHSMRVLRDGEGLATVPVGDVRPEQAHAHQASPGGRRGAWPRCRWAAAGPGRASRSTTPSHQARVWRSRGRAAAHRHTQRPGPSRQATGGRRSGGARNTSGTSSWRWGGIEIPSQRDARNNRQHNATIDGANRHRKNPCTA